MLKKIGLIVAVEIQSVVERYGSKLIERREKAGYQIFEYELEQNMLIIMNCGAGEIAAASGTQFLISEYQVDFVISLCCGKGCTLRF